MIELKLELAPIKAKLVQLNKYGKLISRLEETSPPLDPFIFEAIFAYLIEETGLNFEYEINVTSMNNTTVDFVYGNRGEYKLCFELLSPDASKSIKEATKLKETDVEGIKSYEIFLEGDHPNEHLRPQAQTIRLGR